MFTRGLSKNFQFLGFDYWVMLLVLFAALFLLLFSRDWLQNSPKEKWFRYTGGMLLIIGLVSEQLWKWYECSYLLNQSLPLSLCSLSALFAAWTLFRRSRFGFDIIFFTGVFGAFAALVMADIRYSFPHITFINYYLKHILIVLTPVYMMAVHGFYPTFRSYKRMILTLLLLLPFVLALDLLVGGNYWYLIRTPGNHQSLNFLSAFPYRIVEMFILASAFSFAGLLLFQFFPKMKRFPFKKPMSID